MAKRQSLFQKLQDSARRREIPLRTAESRKWFSRKARRVKTTRRQILTDPLVRRTQPGMLFPGRMYTYVYDPKHKETLPFYDRFPLILMVGPAKDGWYGLNLHYLAPAARARFLDKIIETRNNNQFDETTQARISYGMLSGASRFKEFQPTFKHYLGGYVRSQIAEIMMSEWEIAIFLPTESFQKQSKFKVWGHSRRSY